MALGTETYFGRFSLVCLWLVLLQSCRAKNNQCLNGAFLENPFKCVLRRN